MAEASKGPVTGMASALRYMQHDEFYHSEAYQAQLRQANREGADERILLFENRFITRMQKLHVPLMAHNMVRTPAEQKAAYVRGVSHKDGSKPYAHRAWAVDLVHGLYLWEPGMPRECWDLLGHIGKEVAVQNGLKLVWGGDWSNPWDPAHWECADWEECWEALAKAA